MDTDEVLGFVVSLVVRSMRQRHSARIQRTRRGKERVDKIPPSERPRIGGRARTCVRAGSYSQPVPLDEETRQIRIDRERDAHTQKCIISCCLFVRVVGPDVCELIYLHRSRMVMPFQTAEALPFHLWMISAL